MDPKIWGPSAWRLLHTIAGYVAVNHRHFMRAKALMEGLGDILPCGSCRRNVRAHTATLRPLRNAAEMPRWVYDLHQLVNVALGVPGEEQPSFADVAKQYKNKRLVAEDVRPFLDSIIRTHPGGRWLAGGDPYVVGLGHLLGLLPLVVDGVPSAPAPGVIVSRPRLRAHYRKVLTTSSPGP